MRLMHSTRGLNWPWGRGGTLNFAFAHFGEHYESPTCLSRSTNDGWSGVPSRVAAGRADIADDVRAQHRLRRLCRRAG